MLMSVSESFHVLPLASAVDALLSAGQFSAPADSEYLAMSFLAIPRITRVQPAHMHGIGLTCDDVQRTIHRWIDVDTVRGN